MVSEMRIKFCDSDGTWIPQNTSEKSVNKTTFYCIAPVLKNWTAQPNNFGQTFFRFGLIFIPLEKKKSSSEVEF